MGRHWRRHLPGISEVASHDWRPSMLKERQRKFEDLIINLRQSVKVSLAASKERLLSSAAGGQKKLRIRCGDSLEEERSSCRQDGRDPSHPTLQKDTFLRGAWTEKPVWLCPSPLGPRYKSAPTQPLHQVHHHDQPYSYPVLPSTPLK